MARPTRRSRILWALAAVTGAALCLIAGGATAPAPAQDNGGLPGFFQHLFGLPPPATARAPLTSAPSLPPSPTPTPVRRVHKYDYVPATKTRAPGAPGGAPSVAATFHVVALGDSLAVEASEGLVEGFADKPEIGFVDKARDASGLVRVDYYDWAKAAEDMAKGPEKFDFVIIMLGINDLQPMRDGAEILDTLSDGWRDRYGARVEAVVAPFAAQHIPVAWIGLPPMRQEKFNADAVKLNGIYREHSEKAGAKFIDIYDAFADQDGQYDAFGPDTNGQSAKLRASDGVHFTKAGARKVAHFVEGEIRRALDKRNPVNDVAMLPPDIEQAADDINAQIRREMGVETPDPAGEGAAPAGAPPPPPRPLAGPILPLTGRPTSPGGALASRETRPLVESADVTRVFRTGEPDDPVAGRADDFPWPRL